MESIKKRYIALAIRCKPMKMYLCDTISIKPFINGRPGTKYTSEESIAGAAVWQYPILRAKTAILTDKTPQAIVTWATASFELFSIARKN
jgi:hypothetical protein